MIVIGVNEFFRGGRSLRQDSQPSKRVNPFEYLQHSCRNRRPAHAMKSVAPRNEIAAQLLRGAVLAKLDYWRGTIQVAHAGVLNLKQKLSLRRDARFNQILQ